MGEVCHGDVEGAEDAQQLAQRGFDLARPREVCRDAVDRRAGAGRLFLDLGDQRVVGAAHDEAGAVGGEPRDDRRPHAGDAAGDERSLALQKHPTPSSSLVRSIAVRACARTASLAYRMILSPL